MILHNDSAFTIYFGDSQDHCVKSNYTEVSIQEFEKIKKKLKLENLIFLKQVHGIDGSVFTDRTQIEQLRSHPSIQFTSQITQGEREATVRGSPELSRGIEPYERKKNILPGLTIFPQNGDFLITNLKNIGIGILTADCLPIAFYDTKNNIAAVAHAGWRGAVAQINPKVIKIMQEQFGTKIENLKIFFGPCAKSCCYQVQEDFLKDSEILKYSTNVIIRKNNSLFFDLPKLAKLQLFNLGIKEKQIETSYNLCTICNSDFHSYRRNKENAERQATIIFLK